MDSDERVMIILLELKDTFSEQANCNSYQHLRGEELGEGRKLQASPEEDMEVKHMVEEHPHWGM